MEEKEKKCQKESANKDIQKKEKKKQIKLYKYNWQTLIRTNRLSYTKPSEKPIR